MTEGTADDYDGPNRRKTDQREVLLNAAADLQNGMKELTAKFCEVEAFSKETRRITKDHAKTNRRLAAMVAALALVVVAVAFTSVRADRANDKASRNQEYAVASCEATNAQRAENSKLWDAIIVLLLEMPTPNDKPDKGLIAFTKQLEVQVDKTFMPRDCDPTRSPPPPPLPSP